ncbi:unnamed protein product, partial [Polarella glacialis]
ANGHWPLGQLGRPAQLPAAEGANGTSGVSGARAQHPARNGATSQMHLEQSNFLRELEKRQERHRKHNFSKPPAEALAGFSQSSSSQFHPRYSQPETKEVSNGSKRLSDWGNIFTVMMRHLPNKYTQKMLVREINEAGFHGTYDFLYLPIDSESGAN